MRAEEWMCNPAAVVHGGMAATLLDTVVTLAVVPKLPKVIAHGSATMAILETDRMRAASLPNP